MDNLFLGNDLLGLIKETSLMNQLECHGINEIVDNLCIHTCGNRILTNLVIQLRGPVRDCFTQNLYGLFSRFLEVLLLLGLRLLDIRISLFRNETEVFVGSLRF